MSEDRVPCPDCRELIVRGAKVCRFCGRGRIGPTSHAFVVRQVLGLGFLVLVLLFCLIPIFVPRFLSRDDQPPPQLEASEQRLRNQEQKFLKHMREQEERTKEEMRQQGR